MVSNNKYSPTLAAMTFLCQRPFDKFRQLLSLAFTCHNNAYITQWILVEEGCNELLYQLNHECQTRRAKVNFIDGVGQIDHLRVYR